MDPRQLTQISDYEVVRFVAEGGMAWVFEVSDPRAAGAHRALKLLKPEIAGDLRERFVEEARKLVHVQHPNLVTVHHVGRDAQTECYFYTMQYVSGGTLSDRLVAQGQLVFGPATRMFDGVLAALCKLHESGIAHLDVKPANVLLGENDWPLLADLGISRSEGLQRTTTGQVIGTVRYMSPEQSLGEGCDLRSDVFSAGLTIYRSLVGHSIYDLEVPKAETRAPTGSAGAVSLGDTLIGARRTQPSTSVSEMSVLGFLTSQRYQQRELDFAFPPELAIPTAVQEVIRTACRMNPSQRYATACDLRRAWRDAVQAPAVSAAPVATPQATPQVTPQVAAGPALAWDEGEAAGEARASGRRFAGTWSKSGRWEAHLEAQARARFRKRVAASLVAVAALAAGAFAYAPQIRAQFPGLFGEDAEVATARARADELRGRVERLLAASEALEPPPSRALIEPVRSAFATARAVHGAAIRESGPSARPLLQRVSREYEGMCRELDLGDFERRIVRAEEALRPGVEASGDAALAARFEANAQLPTGAPCDAAAASLTRLEGLTELRAALAARSPTAETAALAATAETAAPAPTAAPSEVGASAVPSGPTQPAEPERGEFVEFAERAPGVSRDLALAADEPTPPVSAAVDRDAAGGGAAHASSGAEAATTPGRTQQDAALAAREEALNATAALNARDLWSDAERQLAGRQFARATRTFEEAALIASEMLASARDRAIATGRMRERIAPHWGCDGERPQSALLACREAAESQRLAEDALARNDATLALAALGDEERALRAYQAERYVAPLLVSQTPEAATIRVARGAEARAGLVVRDTDPLTFRWTYDGKAVGGNGSQLYFKPQEPGLLAVEVDDGFGGTLSASWLVELADDAGTTQPAVGAR